MYLTLRVGGGMLAILALCVLTYFFGPIVPTLAAIGLLLISIAVQPSPKTLVPLLGAFAFVLLVAPFAYADTTVAIGDLWVGLQPYIVAAIGALITAAVGWLIMVANKKLGISIDDSMRSSLQTAATNAAGLVLNQLGNQLSGVKVDVKNQLVADAVNYVIKAAPDAVAHFGLTPDVIAQKIVALLPQVANTTTSAPAKS
jgi:hypothetical protein